MKAIDLNADLGESFGAWKMGDDEGVLPWTSSANVACGFHGGDPLIMRATVAACVAHGVAIGAHVSLPDLQGFGRREMNVSSREAYALTVYQVGALHAFVQAAGARLHHVKPHGALYNMAARDRPLANAIAAAVGDFDRSLILVGLAGGALVDAGREAGLAVGREAFCDRRYRQDGSLAPRSQAGAVLEDVDAAVAQAISIAARGRVTAIDGACVQIEADSLCVHGDRRDAADFARKLRTALEGIGLRIAALPSTA